MLRAVKIYIARSFAHLNVQGMLRTMMTQSVCPQWHLEEQLFVFLSLTQRCWGKAFDNGLVRDLSVVSSTCSRVWLSSDVSFRFRHFGSSHFGSSHFMLEILVASAPGEFFVCFFCIHHKTNFQLVEVQNRWLQIIRGPKPPSARWPQTKPSEKSSRAPVVSRDSEQATSPQVKGPHFPRRTPESNRTAAAAKIARVHASLAVLGDEDKEEVELLKKALAKAEPQAKTPPLQTQIAHAVREG